MKVGIFTFGSRGDVQPFLALAVGLRQAGHDAFLCAPPEFAELVARYDVPFRAMSLNFKDLKVRRTSTETPSDSLTGFLALARLRMHDDVINRDALRLLADAEAIVYAPLTFTAQNVADKLAVPSVLVSCLPLDPSRELAAAFTGMRRRRARFSTAWRARSAIA